MNIRAIMATPVCFTIPLLLLLAGPAAAEQKQGFVHLGHGPHLFIDDDLIAESKGIRKVTQHPRRVLDSPVLGWKEHTTQPYVTVIRDAQSGLFRMWYNYDIGTEAAIAYAESTDGVEWKLPTLNIVGPDNRLLKIGRSPEHGSYGVSVVDDGPDASDKARRYKMMWWSGTTEPAGVGVAFSPDSLHWTVHEGNPVLPFYPHDHPNAGIGVGDITDAFYDPIRGRYGALFKLHGLPHDGWPAGPRAGKAFRRLVGASHSADFIQWAPPWRVIVPETRDEGLLEFYGAGGTIARGPLLISFVRMLHDDYAPEPGGEPTGIGYTTLATSRDGVHWRRHDDIFFDRNPHPGAWDRAMTWIGSAVPVDDELYLYYGGYARGHKVEPTKERQIGLAKMRTDRFVSVEPSGHHSGTLRTIPLHVAPDPGAVLVLNADASAGGRIRVQVRSAGGQVLCGFAFDDCVAVMSDGLELPVQWKDSQQLPSDQPIQLEFELADAKLFAFDLTRD
ncbi:MAG TPA: hypothetical protein VGR35_13020 [Tepidisphaeraceae bacterium]|nr:hypothetical protein [Tepidisphaeraceae bacterium]